MKTLSCALFISLIAGGPVFSQNAFAGKIKLCDIFSNIEGINYAINVEETSLLADSTQGEIAAIDVGELRYTWDDIVSLDGQPMEIKNVEDKAILRICYRNFTSKNGGALEIQYLKNGLFNSWSRHPEQFRVEKQKNRWILLYLNKKNGQNSEVHNIYFKAKKAFGVPYGIKRIEVNRGMSDHAVKDL